jgi:hypothetical protein
MVVFLYTCAVVELLIGASLFAWSVYLSNSAIQAVLGVLATGFGLVTIGLAAILREVQRGH